MTLTAGPARASIERSCGPIRCTLVSSEPIDPLLFSLCSHQRFHGPDLGPAPPASLSLQAQLLLVFGPDFLEAPLTT
jgi:hypothetical protein